MSESDEYSSDSFESNSDNEENKSGLEIIAELSSGVVKQETPTKKQETSVSEDTPFNWENWCKDKFTNLKNGLYIVFRTTNNNPTYVLKHYEAKQDNTGLILNKYNTIIQNGRVLQTNENLEIGINENLIDSTGFVLNNGTYYSFTHTPTGNHPEVIRHKLDNESTINNFYEHGIYDWLIADAIMEYMNKEEVQDKESLLEENERLKNEKQQLEKSTKTEVAKLIRLYRVINKPSDDYIENFKNLKSLINTYTKDKTNLSNLNSYLTISYNFANNKEVTIEQITEARKLQTSEYDNLLKDSDVENVLNADSCIMLAITDEIIRNIKHIEFFGKYTDSIYDIIYKNGNIKETVKNIDRAYSELSYWYQREVRAEIDRRHNELNKLIPQKEYFESEYIRYKNERNEALQNYHKLLDEKAIKKENLTNQKIQKLQQEISDKNTKIQGQETKIREQETKIREQETKVQKQQEKIKELEKAKQNLSIPNVLNSVPMKKTPTKVQSTEFSLYVQNEPKEEIDKGKLNKFIQDSRNILNGHLRFMISINPNNEELFNDIKSLTLTTDTTENFNKLIKFLFIQVPDHYKPIIEQYKNIYKLNDSLSLYQKYSNDSEYKDDDIYHIGDILSIYDFYKYAMPFEAYRRNYKLDNSEGTIPALEKMLYSHCTHCTTDPANMEFNITNDQEKVTIMNQKLMTYNNNRIRTIVKINNYSNDLKSYNHAYQPWLKKNDDQIYTVLKLNVTNPKGKDTTQSDQKKNENNLHKNDNFLFDDPKLITKMFTFGDFSQIFKPTQPFQKSDSADISQMIEHDNFGKAILNNIQNNRNVFMFGYGASGAGKTAMMIYNNKKKIDGFCIEFCKKVYKEIDEEFNDKTLNIKIMEFYNNDDKKKNADPSVYEYTYTVNKSEEKEISFDYNSGDEIKDNSTPNMSAILQHYVTSPNGVRKIKTTRNNPESSRSHVIIFFEFVDLSYGKFIVADLAGVENTFDPNDSETALSTLKTMINDEGKIKTMFDNEDRIKFIDECKDQKIEFKGNVKTLKEYLDNLGLSRNVVKNKKGEIDSKKLKPGDRINVSFGNSRYNVIYQNPNIFYYDSDLGKVSRINDPIKIPFLKTNITDDSDQIVIHKPLSNDDIKKSFNFKSNLFYKESVKNTFTLIKTSDKDGDIASNEIIHAAYSTVYDEIMIHLKSIQPMTFNTKIPNEVKSWLSVNYGLNMDDISTYISNFKTNDTNTIDVIKKAKLKKDDSKIKYKLKFLATMYYIFLTKSSTFSNLNNGKLTFNIDEVKYRLGKDKDATNIKGRVYVEELETVYKTYDDITKIPTGQTQNQNKLSILQTIINKNRENIEELYDIIQECKEDVEKILEKLEDIKKNPLDHLPYLRKKNEIYNLINHIKNETTSRTNEGKYINRELKCLRNELYTSMYEKGDKVLFTAPSIDTTCADSFCAENSNTNCYMMKIENITTINKFSDIMTQVVSEVNGGKISLDNLHSTLKEMSVVIFTVFNISQKPNADPIDKEDNKDYFIEQTQYIDIGPLKTIYETYKNATENKKELITKILDKLKFIQICLKESKHNSVKEAGNKKECETWIREVINENSTINNNDELKNEPHMDKIIDYINNHNASTPLGTLIFTDNMAKFGIQRNCEDYNIKANQISDYDFIIDGQKPELVQLQKATVYLNNPRYETNLEGKDFNSHESDENYKGFKGIGPNTDVPYWVYVSYKIKIEREKNVIGSSDTQKTLEARKKTNNKDIIVPETITESTEKTITKPIMKLWNSTTGDITIPKVKRKHEQTHQVVLANPIPVKAKKIQYYTDIIKWNSDTEP